jgi:DNA-binding NarL/FixJ family response regulator
MLRRYLIVDDSQAFLASARALLESQGMHVLACASNAAEALKAAASLDLDAALVDVELGSEDGVALARTLARVAPTLRVVLISAHGSDDAAELASDCGAVGFLNKAALGRKAIEELLAACPPPET